MPANAERESRVVSNRSESNSTLSAVIATTSAAMMRPPPDNINCGPSLGSRHWPHLTRFAAGTRRIPSAVANSQFQSATIDFKAPPNGSPSIGVTVEGGEFVGFVSGGSAQAIGQG